MFIQVIQGEIKDIEAARATMDRWRDEVAPGATGWLGGTFGTTDDGQLVAVVRFDSEAAAQRNSERPEQAAWWREMAAHIVGEAAFHDYPEVFVLGAGGSDEAGFVQLIQGRIADPARVREVVDQASEALATTRPDVLGATLGIAPDGHFTQTVAFTSEADARAGEKAEPPADAQAFLDLFQDVTFTDLRSPWFDSA